MLRTTELIRTLSEAAGLSAHEEQTRQLVCSLLRVYSSHIRVDPLGNVLVRLPGSSPQSPPPRVMLAAHMDEIGLIVTGVEKGFIRFFKVGGVDPRVLPGQPVLVHGRRPLPGVIGAVPPHVMDRQEQRSLPQFHEMFIDVGLPHEELASLVSIGNVVSFRQKCLELSGHAVAGKALDNRAGVAVLVKTAELLAGMRHLWDVDIVMTVQEEVGGLPGATTSSFGLEPTIAVAVDVTFADFPGVDQAQTSELDKGPEIGVGPNFHPKVVARLLASASDNEIPHQVQAVPGASGTDAWAIQVSRVGVPTGLVSIPLRNMHSTVELLSVRDVDRAARLLAHFVACLDDELASELNPLLEVGR